MIFKTEKIIKASNGQPLPNCEIRDLYHFHDRFNKTFDVHFGLFQNIDNELFLFKKLDVLRINEVRTPGYVLNENGEKELIEEYFMRTKTFEDAIVLEWGKPSIHNVQQYFSTGDELTQSELQATIGLVDEWVLNNVRFDSKTLKSLGFEVA